MFAVRQHDLLQRNVQPPTRERSINDDDGLEFNIIAVERVADPIDIPCWLTVKQHTHLGSGAFSDVYSGLIQIILIKMMF